LDRLREWMREELISRCLRFQYLIGILLRKVVGADLSHDYYSSMLLELFYMS
jgi:hypothetical protein